MGSIIGCDFVQLLGPDISTNILSCLDDPADLIRATCVSRSWHQFVIENGFCKALCLKRFPEVSSFARAIEDNDLIEPMKVDYSNYRVSEKNHKVYAILAGGLSPILRKDCILEGISATSTDNYPVESIQNTLELRDRIGQKPSYWSSRGEADDGVPERLTYRISDFCFITEINIRPLQAEFQHEFPIYSAKAVRFRMGYLMTPLYVEAMDGYTYDGDCLEWTYVSTEFPMTQENCLQTFKLPEPVLCIGGALQIEFLGRVQRQESNGLFYICVSHVQVVGRPLLPAFDVQFIDDRPIRCVVKYSPEGENCTSTKSTRKDDPFRRNTYMTDLFRRGRG